LDARENLAGAAVGEETNAEMQESAIEGPGTVKRVDVVIVNWNSNSLLRECIAALDQSTIAAALRVIIVDNASSDRSSDGLSARNLDLTILRNKRNLGFSVGCNMGAKHAGAEYLLFLNPDVRVETDTVERTVRYLDDRPNSGVGVVGVQLIDDGGQVQRSCARTPTGASLLLSTMFLDRLTPFVPSHFLLEWDHATTRDVDQVMGAYLAVRRPLFERLGGFDERYFLYYEDLDLCVAARAAGWKVVYYAGAVAQHLGGGTTAAIRVGRIFQLSSSRIKYAAKHHGLTVAGVLVVLTSVVEIPARLLLLAAEKITQRL